MTPDAPTIRFVPDVPGDRHWLLQYRIGTGTFSHWFRTEAEAQAKLEALRAKEPSP